MRIQLRDEEWNTLQRATEVFGNRTMENVLHEEMGELMVALSHRDRGRVRHDREVVEELADCFVVMTQLAQTVGMDLVMGIADTKLERLKARVEANDKNLNTLGVEQNG